MKAYAQDSAALERAQALLAEQQRAVPTMGARSWSLRPFGCILMRARSHRALVELLDSMRDDPSWVSDREKRERVITEARDRLREALAALTPLEVAALLSADDAWLRQEAILELGRRAP